MTQAESVLQAAFNVAASVNGVTVYRARTSSIGGDELPVINIKPQSDDAINYANGLTRYEFVIDFEVHPTHGDSPDQLADPIIEALHAALTQDQALLSLVSHLQYKSRRWEYDEGDDAASKVVVTYSATILRNYKLL